MIDLEAVRAAHARIRPHVVRTPLVRSDWLSGRSGAEVRLKLESLQVTHSFKARGALNALTQIAETSGADPPAIVTASAGNHGRAIAWAAERLGLRAVVFTPAGAPRAKLDPIARHGAELRAEARDYEQAEALALEYARTTGARFVSPYNDEAVIAGGGTVALEVLEDWPDVEVIAVPVGGGGLVSGIALAAARTAPAVQVIGVEAEASPAFSAARNAGRLVRVEVRPTIADGLGGNVEEDTRTWEYVRDLVRGIVTVPEQELRQAVRDLAAEEHLIAEGAGVVGIAAVSAARVTNARIAVVLSGSNIDAGLLAELLRG
ncbi:MAG TPA: threonine/serine dehydratase [Vicinamibacterales bacterium]